MQAFITGGTGLLGSNLARLLLAQGHNVTILARSRAKAERQFQGLNVRIVEGDLRDVAGFAPALAGHDLLFHTAAYFREYYQPGDHWATLKAINIDGTIQLLEAAERHGLRKAIYTSSGGVIGMRAGQTWGDEQDAPDAFTMANLYFRSKVVSEEAIAEFLKRSRLEVVLILPGWMFGPGDDAPTSSGQIVLDLLNQRLPGLIDGGGAPCDVRDVAQAMINAVEHGRSGERYIVGGDSWMTFPEIAALVARIGNVPAPRLRIPHPLALTMAFFAESFSRLTGQPTLLTVNGIQTLREQRTTRSTKAIRELGATFRPFEETMRDEIAWYRSQRPDLLSSPLARGLSQSAPPVR